MNHKVMKGGDGGRKNRIRKINSDGEWRGKRTKDGGGWEANLKVPDR